MAAGTSTSSGESATTGPGGAGGGSSSGGSATTDATSASGGSASGGTSSVPEMDCTVRLPSEAALFANWPMPNTPGSGLPNQAAYDTSEPDVVVDDVTGLMWQASHSGQELSAEAAIDTCAALELGGFCDWRIPTRIELWSLSDPTELEPTSSAFDDAADANFAWALGDAMWVVGFNLRASLRSADQLAMTRAPVRCVRAHVSEPPPNPRYWVQGDPPTQTITDLGTGLVWQHSEGAPSLSLQDAEVYCGQLTLDGGGFRLATVKELLTLVDEAKPEAPKITAEVFPLARGGAETVAWTSSSNSSPWLVNFSDGTAYNLSGQLTHSSESELRVFCVR